MPKPLVILLLRILLLNIFVHVNKKYVPKGIYLSKILKIIYVFIDMEINVFYASILLKIEFTPKVDSKCVYIVWALSYTVKDNSKVHWSTSIDNILPFVWKWQIYLHTYMHMLGTFLKIHKKLEIVIIFGDNDLSGIQEKLYIHKLLS